MGALCDFDGARHLGVEYGSGGNRQMVDVFAR